VPKPNTPREFEKMVGAEVEKVTKALKAGGVRFD
jgi:hypothetical protein